MGCTGCNVRRYCSVVCQKENWIEHKPDCTVDALFGIGRWKGVVSEHADILMKRTSDIAMSRFLPSHEEKLQANRARWRKGDRGTTADLQALVKTFNAALAKYSTDLRGERGTGRTVASEPVTNSAAALAIFFADRRGFGTAFASQRDYADAFRFYAACLLNDADRADQYVETGRQQYKDLREAEQEPCKKLAKALGALLNGSPWKHPL